MSTYSLEKAWRLTGLAAAAIVVIGLSPGLGASASGAPDLSLAVHGPGATGIYSPFSERARITNHGTAAAPGLTVSYSTGGPAISPASAPGMHCVYVERGHSGRGGGVTVVGDSCSETLPGGLAPGHSVTIPLTMTETRVEMLTLTFMVSTYPAAPQLNLVSHTVAVPVPVIRPPAAAGPSAVEATQSEDQLNVHWRPARSTAPYISSSAITATPVGRPSAPVLTGTVLGTARRGSVPGVLADTTYSVTVANNDGGGPGAPSKAYLIKTAKASIPPSAPTINYAWGYADIRWTAPPPGNSVIDRYEVLATGGGHTIRSFVPGSTLTDYLSPQPADSLTVKVRAHNAAGWGHWSAPVIFSDGGGN